MSDSSHKDTAEIPSLGHSWIPATFTQPKICSRCGQTQGTPDTENTVPTYDELKLIRQNTTYPTTSDKKVTLVLPTESEYLSVPYRTTIKATSEGGKIYVMPKPKSGNGNLGTIKDGTEVIIVAKHNSYLFFVTSDGRMGWNGYGYFD